MRKQFPIVTTILIAGLVLGTTVGPLVSATVPGVTEFISVDSSGGTTPSSASRLSYDGGSGITSSQVSGDGRYVAFSSGANNLVTGDTNAKYDAFVRDTTNDTTERISLGINGMQTNSYGYARAISYSGRFVLFELENTSANVGLYLRDRLSQTTSSIAYNASGARGQGISADGRFVLYSTAWAETSVSTGGKLQVYSKDLHTNTSKIISLDTTGSAANSDSIGLGMSCDGNVMAFSSGATNLPGNASVTAGKQNIFLAVAGWSGVELTNITNYVSGKNLRGGQVACNGNEVAYIADTTAYKYNRLTNSTETVSLDTSGIDAGAWRVSVSGDGRFVAFITSGSTVDPAYPSTYAGTKADVYLRDTKNNTTQLITFTPLGNRSGWVENSSYYPGLSLSPDGSKIAYNFITPNVSSGNSELITGLNTGTTNTRNDIYESSTGF